MTEGKGEGYQGVKTTEQFEYEHARNHSKFCYYWEKWEALSGYRNIRDSRDILRLSYSWY